MQTKLYEGWYQLAFERELKNPVTPVKVAQLPLNLVRTAGGIQAFDAACPHRGAHLGYGGRLDTDAIICPFHGRRIGLGEDSDCPYKVRRYPTLSVGGLLFVLIGERRDHGFRAFLKELDRDHFFVQGFTMVAKTDPETVIENGFDPDHFRAVHGLKYTPDLRLVSGSNGEMVVEGTFVISPSENGSNTSTSSIRFIARIFSPNLCVTKLCSAQGEHLVISAATPADDGQCTIRVSLALPPGPNGQPPDPQVVRALLRDSKLAYDQDLVIWQNLVPGAPCRFDAGDELVIAFRKFCHTFLEAEHHAQGGSR